MGPLRRPEGQAVLAGLLLASGQAPLGAWPLALGGLGWALALVSSRPGPRAAARCAFLAGLGYFAAVMAWLVEPFFVDPWRHGWMAPLALAAMAGGLAAFWAGAAWGAARLVPGGAVALGLALVLAEALRGVVLGGLPWGEIGQALVGTPHMQLAALTGPHGLTALMVLAAALPVAGARAGWPLGRPFSRRRGAALGLGLSALLLLGTGLWGATRPELPPAQDVAVRLVQPNAAQHLKWRPEMARVFFERQLALTAAPPPAGSPPPDLVVWPESAIAWPLGAESGTAEAALAEIAAAAPGGAPVALGVLRYAGAQARNALVVVDATGTQAALYDKVRLVPFGEVMPLGGLAARLGLRGLAAAAEARSFAPGPAPALLATGAAGRAQPLICYEAIFPGFVRAAPARPDYLLQITNDAWFGTFSGPYQHLAQARLRAVEQGLALVRAANTGVSAVIDARGQVVAALPLGVAGALDAALPAALPATPFARFGPAPLLALVVGLFATLALRARRNGN